MASADSEHGAVYPIRVVAEKTGVNPVTLRAWERRYGLIKPHRTPKGHRLYSAHDITTVEKILGLLDRGLLISRVKEVLDNADPSDPDGLGGTLGVNDDGNAWDGYLRRMITAVSNFDERTLEAAYNDALSVYPMDLVTRMLITPLLQDMEVRWENFAYADAERHFLNCYLRNKLGARFHHQSLQAGGSRLVIAGLPGDHSEVGMFMIALAALTAGHRVVLLGADNKLASLEHVVERTRAAGLILHGELLVPNRMISNEIMPLVERLPCPVFVSGHCTLSQPDAFERARLVCLPSDAIKAFHIVGDYLV